MDKLQPLFILHETASLGDKYQTLALFHLADDTTSKLIVVRVRVMMGSLWGPEDLNLFPFCCGLNLLHPSWILLKIW